MIGDTSKMLNLWSVLPWNYGKSGLYNLFDNISYIAKQSGLSIEEFLRSDCLYVNPKEIGWYSMENNWDLKQKAPIEDLSDRHLWGAIPNYPYYGGF